MVKNPSTNGGDTGSVPGLGRSPGEVNDNALQYSCWNTRNCWKSHGQRNLVGYCPGGDKGLDTTEWLSIPNAQLDSLVVI